MEIVVLLEPLGSGGFRAKAGEPFNLCAEGKNAAEATQQLVVQVNSWLAQGCQITTLSIANGQVVMPPSLPFPSDNLYQTDWVFREIQEAIAENRQVEEAAKP